MLSIGGDLTMLARQVQRCGNLCRHMCEGVGVGVDVIVTVAVGVGVMWVWV